MAREKGTGSLQREKSGRYTARICVGGKRYSRSTRTTDHSKAEAFLGRMLAPFGLGDRTLPLAEVWREYEKSPDRRDLAPSTMASKQNVWMRFAGWVEKNHMEITQLKQLTHEIVAEYLRVFRAWHTASTYNNHVCVLREICRIVSDKAGVMDDPWAGVRLLSDDSHTRREFTIEELKRLVDASTRAGGEWGLLFAVGMYTGLRLGDCCTLSWACVNLESKVIQILPQKTQKHSHGRPVTIPIHPSLFDRLERREKIGTEHCSDGGYVMPTLAGWYLDSNWRIRHGLSAIFKDAHIVTSISIKGRRTSTPDATFHSLRHTFVSFSANAGVPLPVVSSIVGHTSTAMTRHYYHENEDALRRAVECVPSLESLRDSTVLKRTSGQNPYSTRGGKRPYAFNQTPDARLKSLGRLLARGLITQNEYDENRKRILSEL